MTTHTKENEMFTPGHRACPGCGMAVAVRLILEAVGRNVIIVTPTGCLETFTSPFAQTPWTVPWVHSLFENGAAVASGVAAALRAKKEESGTKVLVMGGDGATFDIGLGGISGMWERGHDITYICFDNEAYMNTGVQRSSATTYGAATTTTPALLGSGGKKEKKKQLTRIALAHDVNYVATATLAYPKDLQQKSKKAVATKGSSYLEVLTPCCIGWGFNPELTVEISRLAVQTALFPLWQKEEGSSLTVKKLRKVVDIEEYLKQQNRFKHLLEPGWEQELKKVKEIAKENISQYNLLERRDEG